MRICRFDFRLLRVRPSTEINSETVRPTPPRCFSKRRKEISVTPAIGERISGGSISIFRILKGLISIIKKPHEILPHVACKVAADWSASVPLALGSSHAHGKRDACAPVYLPIHYQRLCLL